MSGHIPAKVYWVCQSVIDTLATRRIQFFPRHEQAYENFIRNCIPEGSRIEVDPVTVRKGQVCQALMIPAELYRIRITPAE